MELIKWELSLNMRIRRKPRNKDKIEGFYLLMKYKLDNYIANGKITWISNREMIRKI